VPPTAATPPAAAVPPPTAPPPVTQPAAKPTEAGAGTDAALVDRIKSQLASDSQVKEASIDVTAKSGVVTLHGMVPTRTAKERALTVARGIDGVTQVVDRIQVSPMKSSATKSSPARKAKR
jgi:hyperosmotically inducible protein